MSNNSIITAVGGPLDVTAKIIATGPRGQDGDVTREEFDTHLADIEAAVAAITAPPQWIDATLQNGWTGVINYRKNQIGQIEIKGLITPGTLNQGTIIAQLPSGYYSNRDIVIPATRHSDESTRFGILLNNTGAICIYGTDVTAGTSYNINCVGVLD